LKTKAMTNSKVGRGQENGKKGREGTAIRVYLWSRITWEGRKSFKRADDRVLVDDLSERKF